MRAAQNSHLGTTRYTGEEKIHIANKYLIPKQATEHGLKVGEHIEFTEEGLREIIHSQAKYIGMIEGRQREHPSTDSETMTFMADNG